MLSVPDSWSRPLARLYDKQARWLTRAATLVLTIVVAARLADFAWLWVPVPESARWRPAPVVAPLAAGPARGPDVAALTGAHLFGLYQAPSDPGLDQMDKAPDTRLNLTLLGILAADEERGSRALISDGAEEKPYSVGDKVPGGVTLQAIFPDRVILARNGQLETLRLDKDKPSAPLTAGLAGNSPASTVSSETAEMLSRVREQLLTDPSKASDYIRVQPANVNGAQRGYRIYPGRDRSVFNGAGLRPGDLVTSLNGVNLGDPAQALQMLGDLGQAQSLSLTIERGGVQQNVVVNFGP